MSSSPSDEVRRQNQQFDQSHVIEVIKETEVMSDGLGTVVDKTMSEKIMVEKWKILAGFYYLAFTSVLCVTAIVVNPADPVRIVALAVWATSAALAGALLRSTYGASR